MFRRHWRYFSAEPDTGNWMTDFDTGGARPDMVTVERTSEGKTLDEVLGTEQDPPTEDPPPTQDEPAEEAPPRTETEETTDAAPSDDAEPPAEGGEEAGSDSESPEEQLPEDVRAQNAIENILGKYDGKPESMASAIYGLRQKQTATAEERNKFESLLNDNFEKSADGEFVLRADAAAKRLGQERGNGSSQAPIQVPPVEAVLKAVEQEAREVLATQYESEQVEEILKVQAPRLKAEAESKIEFFKGEISKRENERKVVAGNIIRDHLSKHPEHKDVMPQVAELLGGLPNDEMRTEAVIGNWFGGIGRLAGLIHWEANRKTAAKEIFAEGRKFERDLVVPGDSAAPTAGGRGSSQRGRADKDPDAEYKHLVMTGGKDLAPIESMLDD